MTPTSQMIERIREYAGPTGASLTVDVSRAWLHQVADRVEELYRAASCRKVWFIEVYNYWTHDSAYWEIDYDAGVWASREAAQAHAMALADAQALDKQRYERAMAKAGREREAAISAARSKLAESGITGVSLSLPFQRVPDRPLIKDWRVYDEAQEVQS